ncbi:MAG: hypothetical protein E7505_07995 [Ruminococcus sp.]|nr:hypothetical protein [Ruminococcus sp.]
MKGYLKVCVHMADKLFPVKNARVKISRLDGETKTVVSNLLTDENGYTGELSLNIEGCRKKGTKVFDVYYINVENDGFAAVGEEAEVYSGEVTVHSVELIMREIAS